MVKIPESERDAFNKSLFPKFLNLSVKVLSEAVGSVLILSCHTIAQKILVFLSDEEVKKVRSHLVI